MAYSRIYFLGLFIFIACGGKNETIEEDPQRLRTEIPATEVRTVLARIAPFEYLINTSGKINSNTDIEIKANTTGIVEAVLVKNGERVKEGALLARIDNTRQSLALDRAKLTLQEREIVFQDQLLSYTGTDTTKYKYAKDNIRITSGLANAELAYREAKLEFDNTFLLATGNGIISNLELHAGSTISIGQAVCHVHDPAKLVVLCEVLEADALKLKFGTNAEIKTLSGGSQPFSGNVVEINPRVDSKSNLVKVMIAIQPSFALMPGMTVQVILKIPYQKNIIIPKEAVVVRSGRHVVFTEEGGLAKWNYVTIGNENGKQVEITEGLKENQSVITTNNLQLAHDAPVSLLNN